MSKIIPVEFGFSVMMNSTQTPAIIAPHQLSLRATLGLIQLPLTLEVRFTTKNGVVTANRVVIWNGTYQHKKSAGSEQKFSRQDGSQSVSINLFSSMIELSPFP